MDGINSAKREAVSDHQISVVVNTFNEERCLPNALRSVRSWVDEIVVVDMQSEDRTVEIAQKFGAKVYFHHRLPFADPARAFAVAQATGDWILMLDADELVPFPLSRKLLEIAANDCADVVNLHWVNYLLGAPLMRTGWGPHQDSHMRFFKRGCMRTSAEVHNFLHPAAGVRIIDIPYQPGYGVLHFNYLDVTHFVEKLNRYSTIEAQQARDRRVRATPVWVLARVAREFLGRYILASGYRDGWRGFYLSLLMASYRVTSYAKLRELYAVGPRSNVELIYQQEAERMLRQYEEGLDRVPDAPMPLS